MTGSSLHRLPFGMKDGRMVDISEIPKDKKGLSCGCICPQCLSPLQANKGDVNSHYFSHDPKQKSEVCEGALETAIHKMAKQIINETGHTVFPELVVTESVTVGMATIKGSETIEVELDRHFDSSEEEVTIGDIRPDVVAQINGESVVIEVAVTHFVDTAKRNKLRQLGLPAIEIDLSKHDRMPSKADLFKQIIISTKNKKWLSNPKAIDVRKQLKAKLQKEAEDKNKIYESRLNNLHKIKQVEKTNQDYRTSQIRPIDERKIVQTPPEFNEPVRHMLCEACRHVFVIAKRLLPFHVNTTPCPECDHDVSCTLVSTRRLPEN